VGKRTATPRIMGWMKNGPRSASATGPEVDCSLRVVNYNYRRGRNRGSPRSDRHHRHHEGQVAMARH